MGTAVKSWLLLIDEIGEEGNISEHTMLDLTHILIGINYDN